ncbi:MAG: hypothetical protein M3O82_09700, partial [Verrucomicrobiota bacterium]|nr:hypothetical protein [Verrucomicrobiota bacterium]
LRDRRLRVYPWAERLSEKARQRWVCITREKWREDFESVADELAGSSVYVTVDLDCLRSEEAITNWENGLFTAPEIAWALDQLRSRATIVGCDVCGAYSPQKYARFFQTMAGKIDHPPQPDENSETARSLNLRALQTIWPALTGADSHA